MKAQYLQFNADVDRMVKDATVRARVVSAALAKAMSDLAQLPSAAVDNPANFFNMNVQAQMRNELSQWNENLVFDVRQCMDYIRMFWMLRYSAAHPASRPVYSLDCGFFDCAFGVPTFVSDDACKFLNENKQAVLFLATSAAIIVHEQREAQNG
jgi:hypothetical protein